MHLNNYAVTPYVTIVTDCDLLTGVTAEPSLRPDLSVAHFESPPLRLHQFILHQCKHLGRMDADVSL